jgi:hypothetical protein
MGFFQDLFGDTSAKAAQTAAQQKIAGLNSAQAAYDPLAAQARTDISTGYTQAQDAWQPVYNVGQAGANFYADVTGANGPEGQARARATFQTDPGYQFAVNQALQATQRQQGAGGFQNSGNVNMALQDRASGLAQQQYGNWVGRIAPFLGYSLGGAQGLSQAYTGQGTALGGLDLTNAQQVYGTNAGVGATAAAGTLGEAAARTAAAGNIANLGTKLLGYALAPVTGGASTLLNSVPQFWGGAVGDVSSYPSNIDEILASGKY